MSLSTTIQDQIKDAMRARESLKLDTLRMLKSEIKNREIDQGSDLGDDQIMAVIRSMVKKRTESAEAYDQGDRAELAAKERQEIEILQAFLPAQLSDDAITAAIDAVLSEAGGATQFGPLMGQVMKKLQGKADGKRVGDLLRAKLQ